MRPPAPARRQRAVFLDRDGTLNVDVHYIDRPERIEVHQGVAQGLRLLRQHGFLALVVTNQSGISRGLYTRATVEALHVRLRERLRKDGADLDGFYYCPHAPDEGCPCRKPGTALFVEAAQQWNVHLPSSAIIGDRLLDVQAGAKLGLLTAYVPEPGAGDAYASERGEALRRADLVASSFLAACQRVLARG